MIDIAELVNQYNAVEAQQTERLTEIYKQLLVRKGYRLVRFSSGQMWSNCWDQPERLAVPRFVDPLTREITEYHLGD